MKPRRLSAIKAELVRLEREKKIIPIRIKALKRVIRNRTKGK